MSPTDELLGAFEIHSPQAIQKALDAGASATTAIGGMKPIEHLIEMYMRSPRFSECVRLMLRAGATIEDPLLEAILLDDDDQLLKILATSAERCERRKYLECAFTSLKGVSPLHVCAEFNSVKCARALLNFGLKVDSRAETDKHGLGGQTALFHTVNSLHNHCREMMELLVEAGANLDLRLKGLVWGGGCEWETVVFDVTPISYAQCGLYGQFHRREENVYNNIAYLYRKRYGSDPPVRNVPNRYLLDDRVFPSRN